MATESGQQNKKRVTLKDLAAYTGLSQNTVSRVLHRKPYYTKQVEKLVNEAAEKLGYIADVNAAALKSGSSRTIAIVYDDMVSPFYSYMTSIMAGRFNSVGYDTIIFSNYGSSAFLDLGLLRKVLARNPDAIVSFIEPAKEACGQIKKRNLPFLIFGRDGAGSGFDCVCADEVAGGELATNHLIETGHENVFYVGIEADVKVCTDRLQGYRNALAAHGLPYLDSRVFMTRETPIERIADRIAAERGAGVFCYNDMLAFKLYQEFTNKGLDVPRDFAIVGYDNIQAILGLPMFVTTVDVDNRQMADVGAEVILLKLENKKYSDRSFNKVHIPKIVRGNTT